MNITQDGLNLSKMNIKDKLEEENSYEICKVCNSADIREIDLGNNGQSVYCGNCDTADFTMIVSEEEFNKIQDSEIIE